MTGVYDWVTPIVEETWHSHAERNLIVALKSMSVGPEAWQAARLLRALPRARLVIMAAYHWVAPATRTEEASLLDYLQRPRDAGPAAVQAVQEFRFWKCAGGRLVEIVGRFPTATVLLSPFNRIPSKDLAPNKKFSFAFQQKSSMVPIMNPNQAEVLDLF